MGAGPTSAQIVGSGRTSVIVAPFHVAGLASSGAGASGGAVRLVPTGPIHAVAAGVAAGVASMQFKSAPSLVGLKSWLRADAGLTLSGSNVTAWADQSGNGNGYTSPVGHQPILSGPALNGLPGITFDGSTTYMVGGPNLQGASYVFIVFQAASTPHTGYSVLTIKGTSPVTKFAEFMFDLSGGGYRPYDFANDIVPASPTAGVGSATAASSVAQAFEWSYDGTGPTTSPGAYTATVNGTGQTIITDTTGLGRAATDQGSLGARVTAGGVGSFFLGGKVFEVLIYDRIPAGAALATTRAYLAIRTALPIG